MNVVSLKLDQSDPRSGSANRRYTHRSNCSMIIRNRSARVVRIRSVLPLVKLVNSLAYLASPKMASNSRRNDLFTTIKVTEEEKTALKDLITVIYSRTNISRRLVGRIDRTSQPSTGLEIFETQAEPGKYIFFNCFIIIMKITWRKIAGIVIAEFTMPKFSSALSSFAVVPLLRFRRLLAVIAYNTMMIVLVISCSTMVMTAGSI